MPQVSPRENKLVRATAQRERVNMPRRGAAPRRELAADPVYDSTLVTQVITKVLQRGKRGKAERIVYDALDMVAE